MSDPGNQTNQPSTSEDRPLRCPSCGTGNRADARWCSNCAQPLGQAGSATPGNGESRTSESNYTPPSSAPSTPSPSATSTAPVTPASPSAPSTPSTPSTPPAPTTPVSSPTPPPPPPTTPVSTPSSAPSATPSSPTSTPSSPSRPSTPAPTTPAPAPARPPAPKGPTAPAARAGRPSPLLLGLLALLALTTLIFGWMALSPNTAPVKTEGVRQAAAGSEEEEIEDVSSRFTQNLLSYSPDTVDQDINQARELATEDFATRQISAFGDLTLDEIVAEVKEKNATSTLTVKGVAITSQDDETATVLVVGERTIDSDERNGPDVELQVVQLTLLNDDGWKVDDASPATSG